MKKFLVLYMAPKNVVDDWKKTDPEVRKAGEKKMQADWQKWMGEHSEMFRETAAAYKTKRVSAEGVSDFRNDTMLYSFIEAESHEAAAKTFENHPHFSS